MHADPAVLISRAVRHLQAGQPHEAKAVLDALCRSGRADANAWFLFGASLHQVGELDEALNAFVQASLLRPGNTQAWSAKAAVLLDLKRPEEALDASNAALALAPGDPELIYNSSRILESLGHFDAALAGYRKTLERIPDFLPALLNRTALLAQLQRHEAARDAALDAVRHHPEQPDCWYNLGDVNFALLKPAEALCAFERALATRPEHLPALMGKATALSALGRFDEAFDAIEKVKEQDAGFFSNFKSPLLADYEEKSLAGDPRRIFCAMQFQRLEHCDWTEWNKFRDTLRELIVSPNKYSTPLYDRSLPHPALAFALGLRMRLALVHQVAEGVAAEAKPFAPGFSRRAAPRDKQRLRIGYVSPDFRAHATAHLTRRLYGLHDSERYEVFAYALHPGDGSAIEADIRRGCEHYRPVAHLESAALIEAIRTDEIDILVDLAGYTRYARPEIFAARGAPIQVGYLGFPGTLGGEALDYVLVDSVVCPEGCDSYWSESLVRLPGTYAIYDDQSPVAAQSARAIHGLPDQALVLCCFNTAWKINPQIFAIWMRLLKSLPQAVLWLWSATSLVRENLRSEAARMGVDASRLVFCGPLEHAAHLSRYPLADVFLDTLPCNAHTTAADALWMGVPVVTCLGAEMQGRVAASLLRAAGLPELVTANLAEYEDLIYRLATEPGILSGLRSRLLERKRGGMLFNTEIKVRDLERAFQMMWKRHCNGLPPAGFDVPPSDQVE